MSHTPGPWIARRYRSRLAVTTTREGKPTEVAVADFLQSKEDSALIAAAPDLLAACKEILASILWEKERSGITYNGFEDLKAAIARAEGKE